MINMPSKQANMEETSTNENVSSEKDQSAKSSKNTSTSAVLANFLQQKLSKQTEQTSSCSSIQIEVTTPKTSSSSDSTPVKTIWVLHKKNEEGPSPKKCENQGSSKTGENQGLSKKCENQGSSKKCENQGSASVLKNLQLDHQYLSQLGQEVAPIVKEKEQQSERLILPKPSNTVYSIRFVNPNPVHVELTVPPAMGKKNLRMALSGTDEFLQRRVQRAMELLGTDEKGMHNESDGLPCILNAASIQNNFQDVLNMTAFRPIPEGSGQTQALDVDFYGINKTKHSDKEDCTENTERSSTSEDKDNQPVTEQCLFEDNLDYVLKLMIQRWSEYLKFTQEDLYNIELENAKNLNSAPEVIEMLQDRGRYVWQLIEEL